MAKMSNPKGLYSSTKNPCPAPKEVKNPSIGPNSNSDANKANSLLKKAYNEKDSLRGKSGM